jgi:hypothetical protein
VKTEVGVSGQLALATSGQVVAAAVWETLPVERQIEVTVRLAAAGGAGRGGAR